ncbi:MAG: cytochrome d ubiquinol oxidase subunit II [bacterium]
MSDFIHSIGLAEVVAGIMVVVLNAYVLMGGADFGGGVWDLFASGPRRAAQRDLIANSIAPIWEANHVWLIVVVVMLFTAFPAAFGMLGTVLHIPITLLLVGIVLRGSAFVFRSYGTGGSDHRHTWGRAFAIASTVTPILLGLIIGAVASEDVGAAAAKIGKASFADVFVAPWLAAFPMAVGLFALALFAFLAAVYLTIEARDADLREDFRRRGLVAAVVVFALAGVALYLSRSTAPRMTAGIVAAPWSLPLHVCTGAAAIVAIVALWVRRYHVARIAAATQVSLILWGWALAQYPFIIPNTLTIRAAASPPVTLKLLLIGLAGGGAILIPSLRYLFRTFAGRAADSASSLGEHNT